MRRLGSCSSIRIGTGKRLISWERALDEASNWHSKPLSSTHKSPRSPVGAALPLPTQRQKKLVQSGIVARFRNQLLTEFCGSFSQKRCHFSILTAHHEAALLDFMLVLPAVEQCGQFLVDSGEKFCKVDAATGEILRKIPSFSLPSF